jgi:hypothetical protein
MRHLFAALCLVSGLSAVGCSAPLVNVPMIRPAAVNIAGVKKLAVLGLRENPAAPPQLSHDTAVELIDRLNSNGYFTVVDGSDQGQLSRQLNIPTGSLFEPAALSSIAGALAVDGLLIGEVEYLRVGDERGIDMVEVPLPVQPPPPAVVVGAAVAPGVVVVAAPAVVRPAVAAVAVAGPPPPSPPPPVMVKQPFPFVLRRAELRMTLKLLRTTGLSVIYSEPIELTSLSKVYEGSPPNPKHRFATSPEVGSSPRLMQQLPPAESIVTAFAAVAASRFVPTLVPTRYTKVIEFTSGSNPYLKRGLELARANAWELARDAFTQGIKSEPTSAALHYDLAVTLEAVGDLEAAKREYEQALLLEPSTTKYQHGYRSVQATIAEQARLNQQTSTPTP